MPRILNALLVLPLTIAFAAAVAGEDLGYQIASSLPIDAQPIGLGSESVDPVLVPIAEGQLEPGRFAPEPGEFSLLKHFFGEDADEEGGVELASYQQPA